MVDLVDPAEWGDAQAKPEGWRYASGSPYVWVRASTVNGDHTSPLVISVPHSGVNDGSDNKFVNLRHYEDEDDLVRRTIIAGIDHCVPAATGFSLFEKATIVGTDLSRAVIDVNRSSDDYDSFSVVGGPVISRPHGVIWNATLLTDVNPPERLLKGPYSRSDFTRLLGQAHYPFQRAVTEALYQARAANGYAILVDLHSLWPNVTKTISDGEFANSYLVSAEVPSLDPADLILMNSGGRSTSLALEQTVLGHFEGHDLKIERRAVAPGVYSCAHTDGVYRHGDHGMDGIQVFSIEVVGHQGLEPRRAWGEITDFDPNPDHIAKLQGAYQALFKLLLSDRMRDISLAARRM